MANAAPLLISAGGTGGGVYPAIAVVEALRRVAPTHKLYFIGAVGGMEHSLVPRELFSGYHEVRSGPLNGVGILRAAMSALKILVGTVQAWSLIGQMRPALLFLTGGWATFPTALAAWLRRVPIVIFLPDVEPARAIKVMSRLARVIMATTSDSAAYFTNNAQVVGTGYPLRSTVINATRTVGVEHFKLDPLRKTLLVFGGSRGARSINNALAGILPDLLADGLQIIHITGELDWPTVQGRNEALTTDQKEHYHPFSYLHDDMGLALAAADLAVSRAGASSLGEFPQFGLPSILIPLAFAWRYQRVNADWLASRDAAIRLDDEQLTEKLLPTIRSIIGDPIRLEAMHKAAAALRHPDAAGEIAKRLLDLADS